ncbi:hypothetical protein AB0M58_38190 [Streptomyces bobili]|uniref:hypothetical protein n=1 Tax=Streptomyces bobili TaxID=67280 RepID=UPI003435D8E4
MDPVMVTAGWGVTAAAFRLGYFWLSARSHARRIESQIHHAESDHATLMKAINLLPPGSEITEVLPDGRQVTIKLPASKAA